MVQGAGQGSKESPVNWSSSIPAIGSLSAPVLSMRGFTDNFSKTSLSLYFLFPEEDELSSSDDNSDSSVSESGFTLCVSSDERLSFPVSLLHVEVEDLSDILSSA